MEINGFIFRSWLDSAEVLRVAEQPSGLGGWNIGHVVAHLGLGLGMVADLRPAPSGARPLSPGQYIAEYQLAAMDIAKATEDLAKQLGPDPMPGLERIADDALAALEQLSAPVVVGRRGPITLEDYVMTRLLELVVHADDLFRVVAKSPQPVLDVAANAVGSALAATYREVSATAETPAKSMTWIRMATGREPSSDPRLPLL